MCIFAYQTFFKQSKKQNKMKKFPIILTLILCLIFTVTLITLVIKDSNRMQTEIHKLYKQSIIDGTSKLCDNTLDFTILK